MSTTMKRAMTGIAFVLVFAICHTTASADILKHPYLIYPGQNTQMEVLWQDNTTQNDTLSWGFDTTYSMGTISVPEYSAQTNQHKYTITGLTPNTKYYYKVADSSNNVYGTGSFIAAPDENVTSIRFLGMGDSRSQPFALDNLMQAMRNFYSQPGNADYQRLTIHNGDWVSTDGESYWTSQWFDPTKTDIVAFTANTPINGCKGNHDNASGYSATFPKYFPFPYTNLTAKTASPATDASGNPYYNNLYWSYDYGPVHFTMVDEYSSYAPGSAQYNWLVNDLATTTKPWKILLYHEPAYSAGSDADNTTVRALEPLVTQYNVDLIYAGHSHNYARTGAYNLAQANGDQIALNVPHITTGGGGAPIYQPDFSNAHSYPHVITAWPAFEFMTFDVEGKTLTMTAYQVNNASTSAIQSASALTISPIETIVLNHFTNVSSQVSVQTTQMTYNKSTGLYRANLVLTNNGPSLKGNVDVVLDGIINLGTKTVPGIGNADNEYSTTNPKASSKIAQNPTCGSQASCPAPMSNVTLVNATGSNNGEPMIQAKHTGLAAGDSVVIQLSFSAPENTKITFNPIVYQE
jgi:predicted phosphodiesterase